METPWSKVRVSLRIKRKNNVSRMRVRDIIGEFDFTSSLHPVVMQYIMKKDFEKLKDFLNDKKYSIKFDGRTLDAVIVLEKSNIDIEEEGNILCDILSEFTIGYDVRAILLPKQDYKSKIEIRTTPLLLVCWDEKNICIWISGTRAETEKTYMSVRADHPSLWKFPEEVMISVKSPRDTAENDNTWDKCEVSISSKITDRLTNNCSLEIELSPFVCPSYLQYAFAETIDLMDALRTRNKELEIEESSGTPEVELKQVLVLPIPVTNSLIQILSKFDSKSIQVTQSIVENVKQNLKTFDGVLLFWEKDVSMIWVTGLSSSVASKYSTIATAVDDHKIRLERAQVHIMPEKEEAESNARDGFVTGEGIDIKVYSASILSLSVDCIVNAANEHLSHGAGVAAVIADAAGYELEKEGRDYIYQYGPIPVGSCCSTTAGKLTHYQCVIHTVGPRWFDYRDKEECRGVLKRSVYVCLKEASQQNLTSIGIPSISAGIFGVPKEICATEYYNAVAEFSQRYGRQSSLREVHFIDKDDQMVNLIRGVFTKCFSGGVSDFSTSKYSANKP